MYYNLGPSALVRFVLLSKFKYRDRMSIVMDILDTVRNEPKGKTKTSIMRSANLNFNQANKYLDLLLLCDLIKAQDPMESHEVTRYRLTDRGLKITRHLETVRLALQPLLHKLI